MDREWRGEAAKKHHSPHESAATQMKRVHLQSRAPDMVEIPVKSQLSQEPMNKALRGAAAVLQGL